MELPAPAGLHLQVLNAAGLGNRVLLDLYPDSDQQLFVHCMHCGRLGNFLLSDFLAVPRVVQKRLLVEKWALRVQNLWKIQLHGVSYF